MLGNQELYGFAIGMGCGAVIAWIAKGRINAKTSGVVTDVKNAAAITETAGGFHGDLKLILVVRTDLKMGKGKIAAQCSHAAVMAFETTQRKNPTLLNQWRRYGQPKVVVKTENEESLLSLAKTSRERGLTASLVQDAGRTQIAPGSKTVLAVGPGPSDIVDEVTGHLKLL